MQKVFNVAAVLALVVAAFVALKPAALVEPPIARTTTAYNVTNGATGFVFASTPYTATNGQVAVDDSQYAYYKPLIDAGVLVQAGATGANVFVNSTLARIGNGGSLDVQAGSTFTVAAPVKGNPAFSGNVTVTGTSTFVGQATASGGLTSPNLTATTSISGAALSIGTNTLSGFSIISASVTNGALVAHNLGAIPKVVCQPISGGTATGITDTIWISATNTTSFTVGIIEIGQNKVSTDTVNINCLAFR